MPAQGEAKTTSQLQGAWVGPKVRLLLWPESCFQKDGQSFTLRELGKEPGLGQGRAVGQELL